jgi:anti-repressor protein
VCQVLEIVQPASAARGLDDDGKDVLTVHTPGGPQSTTIVSEAGLYALIFTSRKPEAKTFKKWITGTVLPSLRKHGAYFVGQEKVATGEGP